MAGSYRPEVARLKDAYRRNPTLFSFPENKTAHSIMFVFKEYDYSGYTRQNNNASYFETRQRGVGRSIADRNRAISTSISSFGSVELPFPKQLQDNTSVRLNAFEREAITEAVTNAIYKGTGGGMGDGTLGSIGSGLAGAAGDIAGAIQKAGSSMATAEGRKNAMGTFTSAVSDVLGKVAGIEGTAATSAAAYLMRGIVSKLGGDVARTIDLVQGNVVNPKEALAFEGVDMKNYSFSWELYPSNATETQTIDQIIKTCKRNALPEVQDLVPGVFERTFLRYPSVVEIKLIGTNNQYFPKFKPCMIKAVNVSYENAAGTVPIMQGGAPGSVTLNMEFSELSAHTREDVDQSLDRAAINAQANQLPDSF